LMYHVITGSCESGISDFISKLGKEVKESYSVREIKELVKRKGAYRNDVFIEFFKD